MWINIFIYTQKHNILYKYRIYIPQFSKENFKSIKTTLLLAYKIYWAEYMVVDLVCLHEDYKVLLSEVVIWKWFMYMRGVKLMILFSMQKIRHKRMNKWTKICGKAVVCRFIGYEKSTDPNFYYVANY